MRRAVQERLRTNERARRMAGSLAASYLVGSTPSAHEAEQPKNGQNDDREKKQVDGCACGVEKNPDDEQHDRENEKGVNHSVLLIGY